MKAGPPLILVTVLMFGLTMGFSSESEAQDRGDCTDPFADAERVAFDPDPWATNFCIHSVPYSEIQSGGPGKDGIPPIDRPRFEEVAAADEWLESEEPVIAVEIEDRARAYPLQILVWHEIVNDRFGGAPIAVTFCPLCYSAIEGELEGTELEPVVHHDVFWFVWSAFQESHALYEPAL